MSDIEILLKVSKGEIPSPADEKPDLDPELVAICNKALAPNPDDRYATADELAAALEGYTQKMGQPATPKEIGAMLSELFQDHRDRVAHAIEERMQDLDGATWADVDATVAATTTGSLPSSSASPHAPAHTLPSGVPDAVFDHEGAVGTLVTSSSSTPVGRKRGRVGLMVGALATVGVAALVFAFTKKAPEPSAAKTDLSATAALVSAPAPSASSAPAPVEFRLALTPPSASISVDDTPLTPASRYVRDGAMHKIRADAPGYQPEVQLVSFDAPVVSLTFDLSKASSTAHVAMPIVRAPAPRFVATATATTNAPPAVVATAPPPATTAASKPPPPDGKLKIDNSNPW